MVVVVVVVVEQVGVFSEVLVVVRQKHCWYASTQGEVVEGVVSDWHNLHLPQQLERVAIAVMVLAVVKPL